MPKLTSEFNKLDLNIGSAIYIRIFKEEKTLEIWVNNKDKFVKYKDYQICALSNNHGPKLERNDGRSPEGFYKITPRQMNPYSSYHLSMDVGYPNEYDTALHRTGDNIFIHGSCVSAGCFAMTDSVIEEIYTICEAAFRRGHSIIPVHIFPFYMTDTNLIANKKSNWAELWKVLKKGYDYSLKKGIPPTVIVKNSTYFILD